LGGEAGVWRCKITYKCPLCGRGMDPLVVKGKEIEEQRAALCNLCCDPMTSEPAKFVAIKVFDNYYWQRLYDYKVEDK